MEVGDTVMISVPEFDRSKIDGRNILARVMEKDDEKMLYTLGTKSGIVDFKYVRSQITPCKRKLIELQDVPEETNLPLRKISRIQSVGGRGQGMVKCNCKGKCTGNCKCFKWKRACNSRCHPNRTCKNPHRDDA